MAVKKKPKPILLCILDGWGENAHPDHNAIAAANTPNWQAITAQYPHSHLNTSGLAVGLPEGQMGNSEVGHMNIGSGRVVMQNLPRIDVAIEDGSLAAHPHLQKMISQLKASGRVCHLMGLLSPGGVHSHQHHIAELAKYIAKQGVQVNIHAFLDGRDTPPASALEYLAAFEQSIVGVKNIHIATISGRYFAMDRDKRWERLMLAYDTMVLGEGLRMPSAKQVIEESYRAQKMDEFVVPTVIGGYHGMSDGDGLIMANFRSDRVRQLLTALLSPSFDGFIRKRVMHFSQAIGMVEYSDELTPLLDTLFVAEALDHILGEVVSQAGLKQLRIAETEKYAHVTFFFNGGMEKPFAGETRILVPSPKVATYDLKPEMSAFEVTDKLVEAIKSGEYDLIVANYANTDMVGHTGDISAAVKAVEAVDTCLGRLKSAIEACGGVMLITADHGNAEQMQDDETGQPHTAHTMNPVPFVMVGEAVDSISLENGRLCDIAPTILELLALDRPAAMSGRSLIRRKAKEAA